MVETIPIAIFDYIRDVIRCLSPLQLLLFNTRKVTQKDSRIFNKQKWTSEILEMNPALQENSSGSSSMREQSHLWS